MAGLFFASICIQIIAPMGAPAGYDLAATAAAIRQGVAGCRWQVSFERRGYVESSTAST